MIRERTIEDLADPALEPFREIRNRNWTERSGWFIAEGPLLVEQLLASDYGCQSVLLDTKYESQRLDELLSCGRDLEILRIDHSLVEQLTGFHFHRGVLGCGLRKPRKLVAPDLAQGSFEKGELLAAAIGIQDPENVGSLMRNCAGLGVRKVIIARTTADPFSRRAMRVAMGTTLKLDIYHLEDMLPELTGLKQQHGLHIFAASLSQDSVFLDEIRRDGPAAVLFGNERNGLPQELSALVDQNLKIRMHDGVDSLNVAVASGIILHHLGIS